MDWELEERVWLLYEREKKCRTDLDTRGREKKLRGFRYEREKEMLGGFGLENGITWTVWDENEKDVERFWVKREKRKSLVVLI